MGWQRQQHALLLPSDFPLTPDLGNPLSLLLGFLPRNLASISVGVLVSVYKDAQPQVHGSGLLGAAVRSPVILRTTALLH